LPKAGLLRVAALLKSLSAAAHSDAKGMPKLNRVGAAN
jgi:hypothetical protein